MKNALENKKFEQHFWLSIMGKCLRLMKRDFKIMLVKRLFKSLH